jgi:hypothetical protein
MTAELRPADWLPFLDREYLAEFVKDGGASVKFVIPHDHEARSAILDGIEQRADAQDFMVARVDAAETRVHMMDQLFFRIAEQVPWERLARLVLDRLARQDGYLVPEALQDGYVRAVAQANDLDENFLRNELRRRVSNSVFKRGTLAKDFRVAMSQLCLAQLVGGPDGATTTEAITDWLTGRTKTVGAVKPYNIYTRVNRSNARFLFESLLDWLRYAGQSGLVVLLDAARLTLGRNPKDGFVHYTKAGRLDAYELLRQFVDATDRLQGLLLVVVPAAEFLDDSPSGYGMGEYQALYFRVFDEIRDRQLVNPMATLIRVSSSAPEVVPA